MKEESNPKIGSFCKIYCISDNKWYHGVISDIFIDANTNEEWLMISYKNNTKHKKMKRSSQHLNIVHLTQFVSAKMDSFMFSPTGTNLFECKDINSFSFSELYKIIINSGDVYG